MNPYNTDISATTERLAAHAHSAEAIEFSLDNRSIIMPYTTTLSRDNADMSHKDAIIGQL